MTNTLEYYEIYPKVVPLNRKITIHVKALSEHLRFRDEQIYYVHLIPRNRRTSAPRRGRYPLQMVHPKDGILIFETTFDDEQPYSLYIETTGVEEIGSAEWDKAEKIMLSVYALADDLLALRPFKGNMHIHTCRSDGVESPAVVLGCYRRAGYDYAAITDHGRYEPSLEAICAYEKVPLDMLILPGEEVHTTDNCIHIVNFASTGSVNKLCSQNELQYRTEVEQIEKTLADIPQGVSRFEIAASEWVFSKIRQMNGVSILCHPNWTWEGVYNIPQRELEYFMDRHAFDLLELINGGNQPHENLLQTAIWMHHPVNGKLLPVEGSDDSHGAVNGKWFDIGKTYVLADSLSRNDLLCSLRKGLCVAVEQYHGECARIYGELRLVQYFQFLHDEYFPLHDALCAEEGRLMLAYLNGSEDAAVRLKLCRGQIEKLQKHLFASLN